MESVILLLVLAAALELCHIWKQFKKTILPWVAFLLGMTALLWAVKVGLSLDGILIILMVWVSLKLLPYWR